MPMMIDVEINAAIMQHAKNSDKNPSGIYLGRKQLGALLIWIDGHCLMKTDLTNDIRCKEYRGIKVYEVKEDDHLAIC